MISQEIIRKIGLLLAPCGIIVLLINAVTTVNYDTFSFSPYYWMVHVGWALIIVAMCFLIFSTMEVRVDEPRVEVITEDPRSRNSKNHAGAMTDARKTEARTLADDLSPPQSPRDSDDVLEFHRRRPPR